MSRSSTKASRFQHESGRSQGCAEYPGCWWCEVIIVTFKYPVRWRCGCDGQTDSRNAPQVLYQRNNFLRQLLFDQNSTRKHAIKPQAVKQNKPAAIHSFQAIATILEWLSLQTLRSTSGPNTHISEAEHTNFTVREDINHTPAASHKSSSPKRFDDTASYMDSPQLLSKYTSAPPKLERLSGQFNAPTELEIEKYKTNRKDRLKDFGKRMMRKGSFLKA